MGSVFIQKEVSVKYALIPSIEMNFAPEGKYYLGKARTNDGMVVNGIFHRFFKKTEHKLIYVRGHMLHRYVYPRIERQFISPMVNDFNLGFVGGWFFKDKHDQSIDTSTHLVKRVVSGMKPMAWTGAYKKNYNEHVEEQYQLEKYARMAGMATKIVDKGDQIRLTVCHKGRIDKLFDLDSLKTDYEKFCLDKFNGGNSFLEKGITNTISLLERKRLEDYMDWIKDSENEIEQLILTGLILGYPHETTFAILT